MFKESLLAIGLLAGSSAAAKTATRTDTSANSYDKPFGETGMGLFIKSVDTKTVFT